MYWDISFSKVQTWYLLWCLLSCSERRTSKELYSPTDLTSSCPEALNLYKILLFQLHTCISQSKFECSAERLSQRKSLTPSVPTFQ